MAQREKRRASGRSQPDAKETKEIDGPLYTLYFAKNTRALGTKWLLEELGVSYKLHELDFSKKEQLSDEHRKIHPHGQVPALTDHTSGVTFYEAAAIALFLAEKHNKLVVPVGSPNRAMFLQWIMYGNGTMEDALVKLSAHGPHVAADQRNEKTFEEGKKRWDEVAKVLIAALNGKNFLIGDELTLADVMIGGYFFWAKMIGALKDYPILAAYMDRLEERPAWKKS